MGFDRYRAVKASEKTENAAPAPVKKGDTRTGRGNRSQQAARKQLTICESSISAMEAEIARLNEEMEACGSDADKVNELYSKITELEEKLTLEMERWEQLCAQAEEQEITV